MEIITGYTGENHVTSADDASLYRGILGRDDYVLDVGNKFAATIIDNNTVRIMDGDLVIQGHQARIRANDYEEVTIDNGTPVEKRNDLIVARYQKNTTTGIESITLEVVKGTPGETATDPEIIQEDLTIGGIQRDYPLYRVSLNGLVLESVTSLFTVLPNLEAFKTHLAENVSELITVTRDLSIAGTQTINTTINKKIKAMLINVVVASSSKISIGRWDEFGQSTMYYAPSTSVWVGSSSRAISIAEGLANRRTDGVITNIRVGSFDINWSHSNNGATGSAMLQIQVFYHGE